MKINVDCVLTGYVVRCYKRDIERRLNMTNFEAQLNEAANTYANMSGLSKFQILNDCADTTSATFRIVSMIMFAAR